jgi:hypothetical protein
MVRAFPNIRDVAVRVAIVELVERIAAGALELPSTKLDASAPNPSALSSAIQSMRLSMA